MSAVAVGTDPRAADRRPGMSRLTVVELRKAVDTRAGFWLLAVTAALTIVVEVISAFAAPAGQRDLLHFLGAAIVPPSILMPVAGVLLVTSEWTQRTAMVTFALVPHRARVLTAKLLAGLALAAVAFVLCTAVALVTTAVAGAGGDTWSLGVAVWLQAGFSLAISMLGGIAFGAVLLTSAPAIVLLFVLPTAWSALGSIHALNGAAQWLDTTRTTDPLLSEPLSALQWARVGTSLALWLVLPIVVGFWRVGRSDVR
jgi:ABC-2 type transport system permease protein